MNAKTPKQIFDEVWKERQGCINNFFEIFKEVNRRWLQQKQKKQIQDNSFIDTLTNMQRDAVNEFINELLREL